LQATAALRPGPVPDGSSGAQAPRTWAIKCRTGRVTYTGPIEGQIDQPAKLGRFMYASSGFVPAAAAWTTHDLLPRMDRGR